MFLENMFLVDEKFQFDCFEYANVLVATWYGKEYDLMFADALNIYWVGEDYLNTIYIDAKVWERNANLERYHGICVKGCGINECREKIIDIICREIECGNPIGLVIDISVLSFFRGKDDDSRINIALVVGVDKDTETVYYRVMHNRDRYTDVLQMSFEELNNCTKKFYLYNNQISAEGDAERISLILSKVVCGSWNSTISMIKKYADYFLYNLDYQEIIGKYDDKNINDVPLIFNSAILYRSRALFSFVLSYIGRKFNDDVMLDLADQLMISAGKFYNIRSLLLKCYFLRDMSENNKQKISDMFLKIAEIETNVLECLKQKAVANMMNMDKTNNNDAIVLENSKYAMLELDKYYNNKAFGESLHNSCGADFDSMGGFFIDSGYPYGEILYGDDIYRFNISEKGKMYDNISCCGQEIEFEPGVHQCITIMEASSHGNFKDYLTVVYESGKQEQILLACSSWWSPKAHFNEEIIWQGEYVAKANREDYYMEKRKLNIYAQKYALEGSEKIVKIILPDCPDIHIFAITLLGV